MHAVNVVLHFAVYFCGPSQISLSLLLFPCTDKYFAIGLEPRGLLYQCSIALLSLLLAGLYTVV